MTIEPTYEEEQVNALADYLECSNNEVVIADYDNVFVAAGNEYLVLDDDDAQTVATDNILNSLWAFNPAFIIKYTNLPQEAAVMIEHFQHEKCEGANDTIRALISDIDEFVSAVIHIDGREHFMNSYDGEEHEHGEFFIYRMG